MRCQVCGSNEHEISTLGCPARSLVVSPVAPRSGEEVWRDHQPLTGVAVYDEIKRLKNEIDALQVCKTCDGDGIMSVLADVLPPDETEVYDDVRCAECDGTGIGYFARTTIDLKAAKDLLREVLGHVYSWQQTGDLKDRIESFLQPNRQP